MQFYIYNKSTSQWVQVQVEIQPNLTKTKDTTNDSFSCALKANTKEEPIDPMTPFKVVFDDDTVQILWILNDSVSIFSMSPITYKHELTLIEYRYFLNKHLLRNTVMSQPRMKEQSMQMSTGTLFSVEDMSASTDPDKWTGRYTYRSWNRDTITINGRSRVKKVKFKVELYGYKKISTNSARLVKINDYSEINLRSGIQVGIGVVGGSSITSFHPFNYPLNQNVETNWASLINQRLSSGNTITIAPTYDQSVLMSGSIVYSANEWYGVTLHVTFTIETYTYTMYDVIQELLEQHQLKDERFGAKREQLFYLPDANSTGEDAELYSILTNTFPPDTLTFTQATWYEALETIFNFYDAGFKFDENKLLKINYYNDLGEKIVDPKITGKNMIFSDKEYNNGKVCYYQNSVEKIIIEKMGTRSITLGVPGRTDYAIVLPKPIYAINEIGLYLNSFQFSVDLGLQTGVTVYLTTKMDITKYVVSEEIWTILDKHAFPYSNSILLQDNTVYFKRGSKEINISYRYKSDGVTNFPVMQNLISSAISRFVAVGWSSVTNIASLSVDWQNLNFYIDYETLQDGRLTVEAMTNKYNGESIVNQNAGMVDLNKLGLRILSESLKDGEPSMTCSVSFTDWESRIKPGDYWEHNGKWVANVCSYKEIKSGVYQGTVEFTKNFNLKALRVESDKEKRLTNISRDQATISEDNYIDYIYVSVNAYFGVAQTNTARGPQTRDEIAMDIETLESMVGQTFGIPASAYTYSKIDVATVESYAMNDTELSGRKLNCPLITYGAGNCLCFEMSFDDPINAGSRLVIESGWFGSNKYFSEVTPYTDEEGWADKLTIHFSKRIEYPSITSNVQYPIVVESINIASVEIPLYYVAGSLEKLEYHKKPNEIFAFNYEWCFLPLPTQINDFFIGSKFINENAFTSLFKAEGTQLYLYYYDVAEGSIPKDKLYSILDTVANSTTRTPITVATDHYKAEHFCRLVIKAPDLPRSTVVRTWAIGDQYGNIYFACNKQLDIGGNFKAYIYFMTRRTKMKNDDPIVVMPSVPVGPQTLAFSIRPDDWTMFPATYTADMSHVPTGEIDDPVQYFIDGQRGAVWTYSLELRSLAGKTMQSGYPKITQENTGSHTNTVSFDNNYQVQNPITHQWETYGRLYGKIYKVPYTSGSHEPIEATITYALTGQTGRYEYRYKRQVAGLIGKTVTNISISPASDVQGYQNTITFDSTTGTFKGKVYQSTEPTAAITYTITYTVNID